jgi:hypothetical protein
MQLCQYNRPLLCQILPKINTVQPVEKVANSLKLPFTRRKIISVSNLSWYYTVLYCTVLYCTVLYCTVLYCTTRNRDYFLTDLSLCARLTSINRAVCNRQLAPWIVKSNNGKAGASRPTYLKFVTSRIIRRYLGYIDPHFLEGCIANIV